MTSIAIYGGSFNPITLSHYDTALILERHFDQVWIMPCLSSMFGKSLADFEDRIAMCSIQFKNHPKIFITPFEGLFKDQKVGTQEILERFRRCYPSYDMYFAIGQDNANSIEKWKNVGKLLEENKFVVFPREGYEPTTDWYMKSPHMFLDEKARPGCSTDVRLALNVGRDISELTNMEKEVAQYAFDKKLYLGDMYETVY